MANSRPRQTGDAKEALIFATERLIAERGPNDVTIKDIIEAAGARNSSAVQYHFQSRKNLILETFRNRMDTIDELRLTLLDESNLDDARDLARALILPLASQLVPRKEGNFYLRFAERSMREPGAIDRDKLRDLRQGWQQTVEGIRALVKERTPPSLIDFRIQLVETIVISGGALIETLLQAGQIPRASQDANLIALVDVCEAAIRSVPSAESLSAIELHESKVA
ncbi:MAG: TetR/AcrR family transcriptional regulator [Novosphingobium sp.]